MRKMTGSEFDNRVRFFDEMAQTSWLAQIHETIIQEADIHNKTILDVGCGSGRLLLKAAPQAHALYGIDLSEQMVEKAGSLLTAEGFSEKSNLVQGEAYALPYGEAQFDVVTSTCVLFLLPEPELGLKEMKRVLKQDGRLIMLNPGPFFGEETASAYCDEKQLEGFEREALQMWAGVSEKRHTWSPRAMRQFLKDNGLKDEAHIPVLDGLAFVTAATLPTS
ncbi:class I SAM-dependent methyltransferase [Salsuginibacillus kocurii]|uniref:class I SAM-dependent methyltransferase n=1 Tax=Salsuginibacillus kocurii TaxID=427078 RepID=UPI000367020B|nr:class I SAM-dependent methyltransferase [Salsuginibacillus kocurii]